MLVSRVFLCLIRGHREEHQNIESSPGQGKELKGEINRMTMIRHEIESQRQTQRNWFTGSVSYYTCMRAIGVSLAISGQCISSDGIVRDLC